MSAALHHSRRARIAIVGASVRGTSLLERLIAHVDTLPADVEVDVDVFDPHPPGSGRIWRAGQSQQLLMNTVAGQSTVFTDDSVQVTAPVRPGPTLAEWAQSPAAATAVARDAALAAEAAATVAASSPSRLLYGEYLRWAWREIVSWAPDQVRVRVHAATVTDLDVSAGGVRLTTDAGETHDADAALLALGWLERTDIPGGEHTIAPGNPVDQSIVRITANAHVGVRGLGMGFFDVMSMLTEGRGGSFAPDGSYAPTGDEPVLIVGSRRGVPFRAKPGFDTVPPAPAQRHLRRALPGLIAARPVDFARDVLPLIERDAQHDHAQALARVRPDAVVDLPSLLDAIAAGSYDEVVAEHIPDPADRFDLHDAAAPFARARAGHPDASVDEVIARIAADDLAEAELGADSPLKMGLHSYQAARAALIDLVTFGGLTTDSIPAYEHFLATAASFGSGPPRLRIRQLLGLHDAGLVRFLGPGMAVDGATVTGADGVAVPVDVVVEAWLPNPAVRTTADPLLRSLLDRGLARASAIAPDAIDVAEDDGALIDVDGNRVEAVHSVGIPHQDLRIFTLIAPIPQANSSVLRETDAAAGAALRHALRALRQEVSA